MLKQQGKDCRRPLRNDKECDKYNGEALALKTTRKETNDWVEKQLA